MTNIQRMTRKDQAQLLQYHLRAIVSLYPEHKKHICKIARLMHTGDAPRSSLMSILNVLVGHENLNTIASRVKQKFIAEKIKKRTLTTSRCRCHACLSYAAEIKCPTCDKVTFCYGCDEYEQCIHCEEGIHAETAATSK